MSNPLVAFFSAQGNTQKIAKSLAGALSAPMYEIKPKVPYTQADLNWNDTSSRTSVEMHNQESRPELADTSAQICDHDVIFLGFPIWWYVAPTLINTFLESYDFSGKKIILFATSGGSGFGKAKDSLQKSAPKSTIIEGQVFKSSASEKEIADFAKKYL